MNLIQLLKTKVNIVYAKYLNKDTIEELPIYYIAGSQTLPPPLDAKEEDEALKKLARVIRLPDVGIHGNTHFLFEDLNNREIADLMEDWMIEKELDR